MTPSGTDPGCLTGGDGGKSKGIKERGEWNGEMTIDCCKKEDKG